MVSEGSTSEREKENEEEEDEDEERGAPQREIPRETTPFGWCWKGGPKARSPRVSSGFWPG